MMSELAANLAIMVDIERGSETALTAAAARAAHLLVDDAPIIFADPLAERLLGDQAEMLLAYHRNSGTHPILAGARAQVTLRSRIAEERVADARTRGVDQYVILGAGLDSFAYRTALPVEVYEVDHPATQAWKRDRLACAGIAAPDRVTFVGVDLEAQPLLDALGTAGFDPSRPAVVSWLGVTVYLTRDAIAKTLTALGTLAAGTELVLDYMLTEDLRDDAGRAYADGVGPVAAERGEPWLSFFTPADMSRMLTAVGFGGVTHLRQRDAEPELWNRTDALRPADLSIVAITTIH
jgi:methyltransferase (TIGR00027 family)